MIGRPALPSLQADQNENAVRHWHVHGLKPGAFQITS